MTIEITHDEAAAQEERAAVLAERILAQFGGGLELLTVELGRRLGLYATLAEAGAATADDLATRAATSGIASTQPRIAVAKPGRLSSAMPKRSSSPKSAYSTPRAVA